MSAHAQECRRGLALARTISHDERILAFGPDQELMDISANSLSGVLWDVCVAGSGPAGLMTSLRLAELRPDLRILLLEYGGRGEGAGNSLDDSIRVVAGDGHRDDPYLATNKGLGGSSQTWGGRCVPFDPVDFFPRGPFHEHCTWPAGIQRSLEPFAERASAFFECGPGPFDLHDRADLEHTPIAEGFVEGMVLDSAIERWSLPLRFGRRYRRDLRRSAAIHLALGVEVREVFESLLEGEGESASSVVVRDRASGDESTVAARAVVLACGGRESTRLLLRSHRLFGDRGKPWALGRFYQGHISGKIASIRFTGDPGRTDYGLHRLPGGEYVRRRLTLREDVLVDRQIQNIAFWLENPYAGRAEHRNGALSLKVLALKLPIVKDRLAPPALRLSFIGEQEDPVWPHVRNVIRELPSSLVSSLSVLARRTLVRRKLPAVFLYSGDNRYSLYFHSEQCPQSENRLDLGRDGESLEVHFALCEHDISSIIRAHATLDEWLRSIGCGVLEYWHAPGELPAAIRRLRVNGTHQIGTTRMSVTPAMGVVDEHLRVWGTKGVFVCSSSVFPTSGQANPTFLVGVFALRLAEHLAGWLEPKPGSS